MGDKEMEDGEVEIREEERVDGGEDVHSGEG